MATITKITNPTNPWRVQIRRAGQSTISKCFPTNVEAKRWARAEETKLDKDPTANVGAKTLVKELVAMYKSKYATKPLTEEAKQKSRKEKKQDRSLKSRLLLVDRHLGNYRLAELTVKVLEGYATLPRQQGPTHKPQGAAPKPLAGGTIVARLRTLQSVLRYAGTMAGAEATCFIALTRLALVVKDQRKLNRLHLTQRNRRPELFELELLEAHFNASYLKSPIRRRLPMWDMTLFAMSTCMRRGEITEIVWEDFNPIDRTIWIRNRKDPSGANNRDDECPLLRGTFHWSGEPVDPIAIMMRQPTAAARTGRIFPAEINYITKLFKEACDACGIKNLHFHDLRHEGVSRLFEDGRPMEQVSVVSGHRSWKDLKTYTNLKPKNLHRDTVTP